jgi:hypothetical protein
MKKLFACFALLISLTGCGNLSPRDNLNPNDNLNPRLQQDINNQQGRIDRLENNQNSMRAEIDRFALISKENNNNGVQILQGDGGLFLVFGLITIFIIIYYFYKTAEGERKTAEILAEQIIKSQDNSLESNVLKAAEYTEVEDKVYHLINKKKLTLKSKFSKN